MAIGLNLNIGHNIPLGPNIFASQLIRTQNGTFVVMTPVVGSSTTVEPLEDGNYKVTRTDSAKNSKPQVRILTESELIAQYGPRTGKNLQAIA